MPFSPSCTVPCARSRGLSSVYGRRRPPARLPRLWLAALAENRTGTAYLVERDGAWEPVTWAEAGERVADLANGLLALGVREGRRVRHPRLDAARVGAVRLRARPRRRGRPCPIYATSSPRDCAYALEHARRGRRPRRGRRSNWRSSTTSAADIPRVAHVLTFADLDDLAARGREHAAADPHALDAAIAAIGEDDLFTFIYTSGTTGPPKACMIRHRNAYEMVSVGRRGRARLVRRRATSCCSGSRSRTTSDGCCTSPARTSASRPRSAPIPLRRRRGAAGRAADAPAERAARVREGARRRASRLRRRRPASGAALVDWALRVGRRASVLRQRGQAAAAGLALAAPPRRAARLLEVQGAPRRTPPRRGLRRARRSRWRSPSSSTRSTS